jgi:hypothetical protein
VQLDAFEGEAKLLGLVWPSPGEAVTPGGQLVATLATDNERVDEFLHAHGKGTSRDVTTWWGAMLGPETIALLTVEAGDFEAPLLELAFPLPEAYDFIERVAAAGKAGIYSLSCPDAGLLELGVARDVSAVRAGYVVALLARAA